MAIAPSIIKMVKYYGKKTKGNKIEIIRFLNSWQKTLYIMFFFT